MLTLSATPIPRTLSKSFSRLTALSIIATPPPERTHIHTLVLPLNWQTVQKAMRYERQRKGQVYVLANKIHHIPRILERLQTLAPGASIGILHGRMPERALVETMERFRARKIDILLSTTIIENGLDISSANTLIVEDATLLGLAQAHQLRGRIGRSSQQAFAYFFYPPRRSATTQAHERLEALKKYAVLGSGIEIAKRDLQIRGSGNLLGKQQSGVAFKIGLNLYYQLLAESLDTLEETGCYEK